MTAPFRPNWLNNGDPNAGSGPVPYARKPSIVDRVLGRLFPTAQYTGLLDPEQQQGLQRQGLLNVGLNLLQAGGPSAQQRGTLANIGSSIQGVNFPEMAQQALQMQAYREQRQGQKQIQGIVSKYAAPANETPEQRFDRLTRLTQDLIGVPGAEHLLGPISNFLAQTKPDPADRGTMRAMNVDPKTGKPVLSGGVPAIVRVFRDGRTEVIGGAIVPSSASMPSEGERRAGALFTVGEDAYNQLLNAKTPSLTDVLAAKVPGGFGQGAVSAQQQLQNQAGAQLYRSYLYIVSGATVNPNEAEETAKTFVPQLGDDEATIARKKRARDVMIQAMRQAMGRGQGGAKPQAPMVPAGTPDGGGDYDEFLTPP